MKDEILLSLKNAALGALTMINSLEDEDLNWKPKYNARTVLQLITHIATIPFTDIKGGFGELSSPEDFATYQATFKIQSTKDASKVLNEGIKYALDHFGNIDVAQMDVKDVKFFYQEEPETNTYLLVELIEHLSLHKGILYVYMREMNYNAGMGTYYGFQPATKTD